MIKVLENCPGCGLCIGICPVNALAVEGSKLKVAGTCVDCGLCIKACPVKQLVPGDIQQGPETPLPADSENVTTEVPEDVETSRV